jgi:hypothetical protein
MAHRPSEPSLMKIFGAPDRRARNRTQGDAENARRSRPRRGHYGGVWDVILEAPAGSGVCDAALQMIDAWCSALAKIPAKLAHEQPLIRRPGPRLGCPTTLV